MQHLVASRRSMPHCRTHAPSPASNWNHFIRHTVIPFPNNRLTSCNICIFCFKWIPAGCKYSKPTLPLGLDFNFETIPRGIFLLDEDSLCLFCPIPCRITPNLINTIKVTCSEYIQLFRAWDNTVHLHGLFVADSHTALGDGLLLAIEFTALDFVAKQQPLRRIERVVLKKNDRLP